MKEKNGKACTKTFYPCLHIQKVGIIWGDFKPKLQIQVPCYIWKWCAHQCWRCQQKEVRWGRQSCISHIWTLDSEDENEGWWFGGLLNHPGYWGPGDWRPTWAQHGLVTFRSVSATQFPVGVQRFCLMHRAPALQSFFRCKWDQAEVFQLLNKPRFCFKRWSLEIWMMRQSEGKLMLLCSIQLHCHIENKIVLFCFSHGLPTTGCTGREAKSKMSHSLKARFLTPSSEVSGPSVGVYLALYKYLFSKKFKWLFAL